MTSPRHKAIKIITENGGTIRTGEALAGGIHPRTLYALRDNGTLEMVVRGLYRLASLPPAGDPNLALVAGLFHRG
ncbi:MAG: type IV toxin-antitoxin system AbiEi family antitoxin domain-containing protein [Candidatus Hydrogenedentes bacterium]|nr:type IV toxin-antitoxin system AbiEi family antitoxin domain-containing protein [Candidatus Hydrogenedentota bacterium]